MLLEISVALLFIWFIVSCYAIWNLTAKQEVLETWIENFIMTIEKVNIELSRVDYLGSFEADDETGTIFEQIKATVEFAELPDTTSKVQRVDPQGGRPSKQGRYGVPMIPAQTPAGIMSGAGQWGGAKTSPRDSNKYDGPMKGLGQMDGRWNGNMDSGPSNRNIDRFDAGAEVGFTPFTNSRRSDYVIPDYRDYGSMEVPNRLLRDPYEESLRSMVLPPGGIPDTPMVLNGNAGPGSFGGYAGSASDYLYDRSFSYDYGAGMGVTMGSYGTGNETLSGMTNNLLQQNTSGLTQANSLSSLQSNANSIVQNNNLASNQGTTNMFSAMMNFTFY